MVSSKDLLMIGHDDRVANTKKNPLYSSVFAWRHPTQVIWSSGPCAYNVFDVLEIMHKYTHKVCSQRPASSYSDEKISECPGHVNKCVKVIIMYIYLPFNIIAFHKCGYRRAVGIGGTPLGHQSAISATNPLTSVTFRCPFQALFRAGNSGSARVPRLVWDRTKFQ